MGFVVECTACGASYAGVLLSRGARCRCGALLPPATPGRAVDREALLREEAALREVRRLADRICFLIVATDTPRVDVDIQRIALERRCRQLFPDRMHVYRLVYESRFHRLWEQFRARRDQDAESS
ncbi:MAG: hypothetical protein JSW67_10640 [Candidatus Latescibacterota bacterium]|nr:MAG: hypothetical protein JSW67_10640 [Candidatus Latescibacterota bacterium]